MYLNCAVAKTADDVRISKTTIRLTPEKLPLVATHSAIKITSRMAKAKNPKPLPYIPETVPAV